MLSLRDKLRSAAGTAAPRKAPAAVAADCYLRQERIPISRFDLPPVLSGETLTLMQGTPFADCAREDVLFLDTETTGLSHGAGTVAFLVGVGFFEEDAFVVRQYLMRDYDEEPFVLSHVAEHLRRSRVICTFNGASFDLPLLEVRYTMQRMRSLYAAPPH
ncbi:MAG: ribonuclease H-like domain-containing protein, partial [Eubacteriales bacterium]|nr:ribonuclease H-like domain-containing protein [Eubacteriales bacterium]